MPTKNSLSSASLSSAKNLMGLQLFSRAFTFVLNQALFRMASPQAFGTAAIQFELMLSTILFLSREGVRNALLRENRSGDTITSMSLLPLLLGFPLSIATSFLYSTYASDEAKSQPLFHISIALYALAAVIELLSEPMHNLTMSNFQTSVRVKAEGLGITMKAVVTCGVLFLDAATGNQDGRLALLAFATGQLAYSLSLFLVYCITYGLRVVWPIRRATEEPYFNPLLLRLSLTMTSQSFVKHLLTEGDKMVLSWFSPLKAQGGYAIAVNYGSLIARIVFQPVEEMSRVFFSKTLAGVDNKSDKDSMTHLDEAAGALVALLSVQVSLAVIILAFGTMYMPIVVNLLLPRQYLATSAPQVLSAWVWYIPVLAFNGGLEAFLSSVATPKDLNRQSRYMAAFSAVYVVGALFFYQANFGDASLVYANIVNLTSRIVFCLHFISTYFTNHKRPIRWNHALPQPSLYFTTAISLALVTLSNRHFQIPIMIKPGGFKILLNPAVIIHTGLGALLACICLGTWWVTSGRHLALPRRIKSE